ncbi:hypothetical protein [Hyphococcus sp.]|uniref:hypothetical protein n=1 Tax=Hyphococcus sp. TaxID=2038636 RepID=UPI003CCC3C66
MKISTIFNLFKHEAFPDWRSFLFWFDTRPHMVAPGLLAGLTMAFYLQLALIVLSAVAASLALLAGGDGANVIFSMASVFVDLPISLWMLAGQLISITAYIIIAENILRVALDAAVTKPFNIENPRRFRRAAIAAGMLGLMHLAGLIAEKNGVAVAFDWSRAGFYLAMLAAMTFITLSSAFREGARMKEEQDLTV